MLNIQKIETLSQYGQMDTYDIVDLVESIAINHSFSNIKDNKEELERKRLSPEEFRPIADAFENLDYTKIFKESDNLPRLNCTYLECDFVNGKSSISMTLYSKPQDSTVPEITKLFDACKMIYDLFPVEKKVFNQEYLSDLFKKHECIDDMIDQMTDDNISFDKE